MTYSSRFWRAVHEDWSVHTTVARHATRSVLRNLRRRLPPDVAAALLGHLPRPLADLADEPAVRPREPTLESLGAAGFFSVVAHESALATAEAEHATRAVFRGLKALLPDAASDAVGKHLQPGLDAVWRRA